ncbi:MAG: prefoldin subunit alpha [Candidatus Altiarchaeales archaeon HGW-Altiarchaeales-1]|nr:MAG: prefoldin subunit alpha [Candidatus Altiarchaeales archaeon HGW-Altiarchaeales-1]
MEEENKEEEKENTHNTGAGNREEELQKVIYQAKALEEHANTLDNQIAMLNGTLQEMQRTIETLDGLSGMGGDEYKTREILLPVGKNVLVRATLKSKNVLFGITDSVFIERTPEDAKNGLNEDIKKINAVMENLKKKHSEIMNKISALNEYGEQLAHQE